MQIGDRVYIWGRHYTVLARKEQGGFAHVQIVPDQEGKPGKPRRASVMDWVLERYVRQHAVSIKGAEPTIGDRIANLGIPDNSIHREGAPWRKSS